MVNPMLTQDGETILTMEETAIPATAEITTPTTLIIITTIKAKETLSGKVIREAILASITPATVLTTLTPLGPIQIVLKALKITSPDTLLPPSGTSLECVKPVVRVVRVVRAVQVSASTEVLKHTALPSLPEAGVVETVQSCHVKERAMDGKSVGRLMERKERS